MSHTYVAEYNALLDELADNSMPTFEHMRATILEDLDDEARELVLSFTGFDAFYDWLETLYHYPQADTEEQLVKSKGLLEIIYLSLLAEILGDDHPVYTTSDFSRRYYSIEVDFEDLRLVECYEQALLRAGHNGNDTLAQQIMAILRQPNVHYDAIQDAAIYFTMDVEEDTPDIHRRITNLIRARVLKARAQAKKRA